MNESQKNTKRSLVIYCISIFACAVALILLASFSQARITREADAIKDKLASAENLVADSKTRLDAVMTENTRLADKVNSLTTENEELKTYKENYDKHLEAEKKLSEMLLYKLKNKNTSFKNALKAFEEAGYPEYLSENSITIYNSIK